MKLPCPSGVKFLSGPLAVSPDDAWIACTGSEHDQVVCFEVATKKAIVMAVSPKDAGEKWFAHNLSSGKLAYREQMKGGSPWWVWFTPSGKRLVCVTNNGTVRWWDVPRR